MKEETDSRCPSSAEDLSAYLLGEADATRAEAIEKHLDECCACRQRMAGLRQLEDAFATMQQPEPPAAAVLRARRRLRSLLGADPDPQVMTLPEVAEFLRISGDELAVLVPDLPAFEIAGQIRVRRGKLIDWVEKRERAHLRTTIESEVAGILAGIERTVP